MPLVANTIDIILSSDKDVVGVLKVSIIFFPFGLVRNVLLGDAVHGALGLGMGLQISIPGGMAWCAEVRCDEYELIGVVLVC